MNIKEAILLRDKMQLLIASYINELLSFNTLFIAPSNQKSLATFVKEYKAVLNLNKALLGFLEDDLEVYAQFDGFPGLFLFKKAEQYLLRSANLNIPIQPYINIHLRGYTIQRIF